MESDIGGSPPAMTKGLSSPARPFANFGPGCARLAAMPMPSDMFALAFEAGQLLGRSRGACFWMGPPDGVQAPAAAFPPQVVPIACCVVVGRDGEAIGTVLLGMGVRKSQQSMRSFCDL
jgi:hypothetical protein